jgi:hypothetical protein
LKTHSSEQCKPNSQVLRYQKSKKVAQIDD